MVDTRSDIHGGRLSAGMANLFLDEAQVLLIVVKSNQISTPKHMRAQFANSSLFANPLYFAVKAHVYESFTAFTDE